MSIKIIRVSSCPSDLHPGQGLAAHVLSGIDALETDYLHPANAGEIYVSVQNSKCTTHPLSFPNPTMPRNRAGIKFLALQILRLRAILSFYFQARQVIRSMNPDILHIHSPLYFLLISWARKRRISIVLTFHGTDFHRVIGSRLLQFLLRDVDVFLCMTHEHLEKIQKLFPKKKAIYIANGVDPVSTTDVTKNVRKKEIVSISNLRWQKDLTVLIDAFSLLCHDFPDWMLTIYGEGPERANLEKKISSLGMSERISLPGTVPREKIMEKLLEASVFSMSSVTEGLPKALLEAMSAGCECVVTDVGECRYVLEGYGKIVPPRNPQALSEALRKTVEQFEASGVNRFAGVARSKDFSWDGYKQRHLAIYESIHRFAKDQTG